MPLGMLLLRLLSKEAEIPMPLTMRRATLRTQRMGRTLGIHMELHLSRPQVAQHLQPRELCQLHRMGTARLLARACRAATARHPIDNCEPCLWSVCLFVFTSNRYLAESQNIFIAYLRTSL